MLFSVWGRGSICQPASPPTPPTLSCSGPRGAVAWETSQFSFVHVALGKVGPRGLRGPPGLGDRKQARHSVSPTCTATATAGLGPPLPISSSQTPTIKSHHRLHVPFHSQPPIPVGRLMEAMPGQRSNPDRAGMGRAPCREGKAYLRG